MIAPKDSLTSESLDPLPNSTRIYVGGRLHPEVQVPMREIALAPTKTFSGEMEANEPVRVYDTSGPWGDPNFDGDVESGLPAMRKEWILKRKDVAAYDGREIKPQDNGYLSTSHAQIAS